MTEILFYHMTESRLEDTLPGLLERSLERGWRVVVQTTTAQHRDSLDEHLWTFRDDSFLPHGAESEGEKIVIPASEQPIWLTTAQDCPNDASVLFLVNNAKANDPGKYNRVVRLFDGHDPEAVSAAREQWKTEKEEGHDLTYWQQGDGGRWEKK